MHVSPQDVIELGKLVQTRSAQSASHSSATLAVHLRRFEIHLPSDAGLKGSRVPRHEQIAQIATHLHDRIAEA